MENNRKELSEIFTEFIKRMAYFEKQIHVYGIEKPIYSTELHVICIIGDTKNAYGIEIARQMGFTKSAASQMLIKLERRGMISKQVSEDKLTKYTYALTADGQKVYDFHENLHKEFNIIFSKVLNKYSKENADFLKSFILELDKELMQWETEWEKVKDIK